MSSSEAGVEGSSGASSDVEGAGRFNLGILVAMGSIGGFCRLSVSGFLVVEAVELELLGLLDGAGSAGVGSRMGDELGVSGGTVVDTGGAAEGAGSVSVAGSSTIGRSVAESVGGSKDIV